MKKVLETKKMTCSFIEDLVLANLTLRKYGK